MEENKKIGLYTKLYNLQSKLFGKKVQKRGENNYHNYKYVKKEAIIEVITEEMQQCGLVLIPQVKSQKIEFITKIGEKGKSTITAATVNMLFIFIDPETGYSLEIPFDGYAEDKQDTALWKAYTGAQKYFFVKFFNLQDFEKGSEPEDDDNITNHKQQKPQAIKKVVEPKPNYEEKFKSLKNKLILNDTVNWNKASEYFKGTEYEEQVKDLKQVSEPSTVKVESVPNMFDTTIN